MLTLTIKKVRIPPGVTLPPTVALYYKEYYATSWTLLSAAVPLNADGTLQASPPITVSVDSAHRYVLRAVNLMCGYEYEEPVFINPYCPVGYILSDDKSYCFFDDVVPATSPVNPLNTIARSAVQYSTCGTYIYNSGYSSNGTGTSAQITTANTFWVNGAGACSDNNTNDGPMNRSGLWASSTTSDQQVGFAVCINIAETKTYYVGIGCDNMGIIKLDGVTLITQSQSALDTQYSAVGASFKVWHIYPVIIQAGVHILELIGYNVSGAAALGCEVYDNTSAEIIAATSYANLNLIFSSKDYVGKPVQIGSNGIGYTCPADYVLNYCGSPVTCRKLVTVPVLY